MEAACIFILLDFFDAAAFDHLFPECHLPSNILNKYKRTAVLAM